jgi:hypothetical protein
MTIMLTFKELENRVYDTLYAIQIEVLNEEGPQNVFLDQRRLFELDNKWIDINKLNNEKFLHAHNITIIKDVDGNIIPIGLVDFTYKKEYYHDHLFLVNYECKDLYKSNQIIENIKKAIKLKYEAVKFLNRFNIDGSPKMEEINLD